MPTTKERMVMARATMAEFRKNSGKWESKKTLWKCDNVIRTGTSSGSGRYMSSLGFSAVVSIQ